MTGEPIVDVFRRLLSREIYPWTTTTEPSYQHGYWSVVLSNIGEESESLLEIRGLRASTNIYGIGITVRIQPRGSVPEHLGSGQANATHRTERYDSELSAYRRGLGDLGKEDALSQLTRLGMLESLLKGYGPDPESVETDLRSFPAELQADDALGFLTHLESTDDVMFTAVKLISHLLEERKIGFNALISEVRNRRLVPDNWEQREDALRMIFSLWAATVNLERDAVTAVHVSDDDGEVGRISCELWSSEVSVIAPTERRMSMLWSEYFALKGRPRFHVRQGTHRAAVIFDAFPPPTVPVVELKPEDPIRSFAGT